MNTSDAAAVVPTSTATSSVSSIHWYYEDDSGVEQGPHPAQSMKQWYQAGFFNENTKVRAENETSLVLMSKRADDQPSFLKDTTTTTTPAATTDSIDKNKSVLNPEDVFEVGMDDDDDENDSDDDDVEMKTSDDVAPAAAAPLVPPSQLCWYYTDVDGVIRGPFSPKIMLKWHRLKYFAFNNTHLRREDETEARKNWQQKQQIKTNKQMILIE